MKRILLPISIITLFFCAALPALSQQCHNNRHRHSYRCHQGCRGTVQRPTFNNTLGVPIRWVQPVQVNTGGYYNPYGYSYGYDPYYRNGYGRGYSYAGGYIQPYGNVVYPNNYYRRGRCR